jgi:hypothetical protein
MTRTSTGRTVLATASVGVSALLAILGLWSSLDHDACAASDLDLAHCAVDAEAR